MLKLFWMLIFFMSGAAMAVPQTYTIDPQHSYVLWRISHFGFSNPSGKWLAYGTLILDQARPQNSTANVEIHVADMITGLPELDDHLRGRLFFNTDRYPTATFVSRSVRMIGKKTAIVSGVLTLHGISKMISMRVVLNKIDENPITDKMTAGFSATAMLKRSDFDMDTLPGLGDEVPLNIEVEANRE